MNNRRYVFHFRPKPNIWPEKHLALGRKPNSKNILFWSNISAFGRPLAQTIYVPFVELMYQRNSYEEIQLIAGQQTSENFKAVMPMVEESVEA